MSYLLKNIKDDLAQELNLDSGLFSYPPSSSLGDISYPCFSLAKERGASVNELALELKEKALSNKNLIKVFSEVKIAGPYLNFYIKPGYLAQGVIKEIKAEKSFYGSKKVYSEKATMIEYANGNTHKEFHIGHLRNILYGEAVKNLIKSQGKKVVPVSYINDFGIHVAKTIWNWRLNPVFSERPESKGYLLGRCYSEASKKLADNPELKAEVGLIMKSIESRQGVDYELWKKTRNWSINYFASIYKELNIKFDHIFYESEVIDKGLEMVDDFLMRKIFIKSQGSIIADLNEYNLGVLPIVRTDGTALYPVADLALASHKFSKYNLESSIYVVDVRQSLNFKQLFKVLSLAGHTENLIHLPYDIVTLPEGVMSSRSGNVISYEKLRDRLNERLSSETKKRHEDWTDSRLKKVVESLSISTIKFEMLKVNAEKIITFNMDEAARSEGFTACYVLYSYARMKSIIRKGGVLSRFSKANLELLTEIKEKELLLKISKYPEVLKLAAEKYNPAEIIKYLFELSQMFNDYYHSCNILKANKELKLARLELLRSLFQVMLNGFSIAGMEALEEM